MDAVKSQFVNAKAVVVGVGDYIYSFQDLPATQRDARAFCEILTSKEHCAYPPDNVSLLIGENATASNLRSALYQLVNDSDIDSTCLVYFSGHGANKTVGSSIESYLCTRETNPFELENSSLSGTEFSDLLAQVPAKRLLVLVDTCFSSGMVSLKKGANGIKEGLDITFLESLSRGSGKVVITSSKQHQPSYVDGEYSLFTRFLLEGLRGAANVRGDNLIRVLDLFHFINEEVQKVQPKQIPELKTNDLDLNFPMAMVQFQAISKGVVNGKVTEIREQLIFNPLLGAKKLSDYLKTDETFGHRQTESDLKRSELEQLNRSMDLFGENREDKAAFNKAVFFLLRLCSELETK
jgi:metacaspase-1